MCGSIIDAQSPWRRVYSQFNTQMVNGKSKQAKSRNPGKNNKKNNGSGRQIVERVKIVEVPAARGSVLAGRPIVRSRIGDRESVTCRVVLQWVGTASGTTVALAAVDLNPLANTGSRCALIAQAYRKYRVRKVVASCMSASATSEPGQVIINITSEPNEPFYNTNVDSDYNEMLSDKYTLAFNAWMSNSLTRVFNSDRWHLMRAKPQQDQSILSAGTAVLYAKDAIATTCKGTFIVDISYDFDDPCLHISDTLTSAPGPWMVGQGSGSLSQAGSDAKIKVNANVYDSTASTPAILGDVFQIAFNGTGVAAGIIGEVSGSAISLTKCASYYLLCNLAAVTSPAADGTMQLCASVPNGFADGLLSSDTNAINFSAGTYQIRKLGNILLDTN